MANLTRESINAQNELAGGPFLAKIVSHLDPTYMGILEVQLLHAVGNDDSREGQLHQVKYLTPFYGVTSVEHITETDDYENTQKSYGMWMIPPDVGTTVMVVFVEGDPKKGYWIGCVPDEKMNFMVPGIAATKFVAAGDAERVPVAEYNKAAQSTVQDASKYKKPQHPFTKVLQGQGLLLDDARGITTSSARREVPSTVFGISTPGPVDKRDGAKQGKVGKYEHKVVGAFVSRLGGSSFVMDDGDDKFVRKFSPGNDIPGAKMPPGPPEYASIEQGEEGDPTLLHNELIRLRTRTGHQILMHNSEDLIYIGNSRGTTWIEMTSDGKLDIFASDSVSIHSKQDFNFYAGRDFNFEAGRNINIKASGTHESKNGGNIDIHATTNFSLIVDKDQKIKVGGTKDETIVGSHKLTSKAGYDINTVGDNKFKASGTTNIKSDGDHIETAANIHMNGPEAASAKEAVLPKVLKTHSLPDEEGKELVKSIMKRIPTPEPYPQHENLDPVKFKADKTDRDIDGRSEGTSQSIKDPAKMWKKYSTVVDTFEKLGEPDLD